MTDHICLCHLKVVKKLLKSKRFVNETIADCVFWLATD